MAHSKKFKQAFLIVGFVWSLIFAFSPAGILVAIPVLAQDDIEPIKYQSQIPFIILDPKNPESVAEWEAAKRRDFMYYNQETRLFGSDMLARYLKVIYDYGIFMATIVATVVLMAGGLIWLSSGGNESKIGQARTMILSSLTGIIIVFGSWVLLNTINPDLLKMKIISPPPIVAKNLQTNALLTCEWRCQGVADKCEGGGGNDNIAASSPWYTATLETCQQRAGNLPAAACGAGKRYNCCCKKTVTATDIPDQVSWEACMDEDNNSKSEGSSCKLGNTPGYCKKVHDPLSTELRTACTPCLKMGDKCNHNITNYECPNKDGVCGSESSGGDCDSMGKDKSWLMIVRGTINIASWLSSPSIECNAYNAVPLDLSRRFTKTYVECRCK